MNVHDIMNALYIKKIPITTSKTFTSTVFITNQLDDVGIPPLARYCHITRVLEEKNWCYENKFMTKFFNTFLDEEAKNQTRAIAARQTDISKWDHWFFHWDHTEITKNYSAFIRI